MSHSLPFELGHVRAIRRAEVLEIAVDVLERAELEAGAGRWRAISARRVLQAEVSSNTAECQHWADFAAALEEA